MEEDKSAVIDGFFKPGDIVTCLDYEGRWIVVNGLGMDSPEEVCIDPYDETAKECLARYSDCVGAIMLERKCRLAFYADFKGR